jgi:MFS family permease
MKSVAPWRFFFFALPFGAVANGVNAIAVPAILRQSGVGVGTIGMIEGLFLLPMVFQFLWTILLDTRVEPGRALSVTSLLAAIFSASALYLPLPSRLAAFVGLAFAGQLCASWAFACCGSLMATDVSPHDRGRASGCAMAGVLGGGALGGTLVLTLMSTRGPEAASVALFLMTFLPSLAAPSGARPRSRPLSLAPSFNEARRVLKSPSGKRLFLFALSPAGAAALLTLMSALAPDFGVGPTTIAVTNGLLGAVSMAGGSLLGGLACDRFARRRPTLWVVGAVALGVAAAASGALPKTPSSYVAAVLVYDFLAGISLAIFPAVVLDVVGESPVALTLYAFYYGVGVLATTYSAIIDSQVHDQYGSRGLLAADGALNLAGAVALTALLLLARRRKSWAPEISPQ